MSNISEGNPAASDQPVSFGSVPLAEQSQSQPQSQVEGVSYSNMGMVGVGPQPVAASRYPGPVECQTCGCTPAVPVTIRRLFGTVVTGVFSGKRVVVRTVNCVDWLSITPVNTLRQL